MGLKRVSMIGFCLAAVAAVVMLAAVIIRPPKIYISEICPSNSETSKKTAMQDKNGEPSDWIDIILQIKIFHLRDFHFQKMAVEISLWADMSLKPMTI